MKAEKTLAKHDPRYRQFLQGEQEKDERQKMEKQGALLAKAIKDTLGDTLSKNVELGTLKPQSAAFPPQPLTPLPGSSSLGPPASVPDAPNPD
eukprot:5021646-Karenia_brevis.AAC.1